MRDLLRIAVVVAGLLLAADLARAGVGPFPCGPGTFSPDGFEPCTSCAPRTFTAFLSSTQCSACDCDDDTVCTLDTCNAATGVCSAAAVPECELVRVEFAGVVDEVLGASIVSVGMPIEGSYLVDPAAPDHDPLHPAAGFYESAARSLELRVGQPVVLAATEPIGSIGIVDNDAVFQDRYGLHAEILVTTPAGIGGFFDMSLSNGDLATFASDALPATPPDLSSFGGTSLEIELSDPHGGEATIRASEFTLTTPEPNASALTCIAAAALAALRTRTRRAGSDGA
jgi:hypothetical protein